MPVYAEMGREGGFRLLDGYFLPPVMLSAGEATSLLLGVALLRRLRAKPFVAALETAEHKLLAAVPEALRAVLAQTQRIIGVEDLPVDMFHREPDDQGAPERSETSEGTIVDVFLQAILQRSAVALDYHSPYRKQTERLIVVPQGLIWDRDRWYLVAPRAARQEAPRLWRADRVVRIALDAAPADVQPDFDVSRLLGRQWLQAAMDRWVQSAPVTIRLTGRQAARLQQDWFYRHAHFEDLDDDRVLMTFGEGNPALVLELLRWLGPGAELIEPRAWRANLCDELRAMLALYAEPDRA